MELDVAHLKSRFGGMETEELIDHWFGDALVEAARTTLLGELQARGIFDPEEQRATWQERAFQGRQRVRNQTKKAETAKNKLLNLKFSICAMLAVVSALFGLALLIIEGDAFGVLIIIFSLLAIPASYLYLKGHQVLIKVLRELFKP